MTLIWKEDPTCWKGTRFSADTKKSLSGLAGLDSEENKGTSWRAHPTMQRKHRGPSSGHAHPPGE